MPSSGRGSPVDLSPDLFTSCWTWLACRQILVTYKGSVTPKWADFPFEWGILCIQMSYAVRQCLLLTRALCIAVSIRKITILVSTNTDIAAVFPEGFFPCCAPWLPDSRYQLVQSYTIPGCAVCCKDSLLKAEWLTTGLLSSDSTYSL